MRQRAVLSGIRNAVLLTLKVLEAAIPDATPEVPIVPTLLGEAIPPVVSLDSAGELEGPAMTRTDGTEVAIVAGVFVLIGIITPELVVKSVAGVSDPVEGPPLILSVNVSLSALPVEIVLLVVGPSCSIKTQSSRLQDDTGLGT